MRERDFRLDFCRGLALIVIFIDHVPDNPLAHWTLHNFAFCDAAEVFVLISGMASYLAYGSRFDRDGFLECARAIGRRWVRIYLAHLLLFAGVALLLLAASRHFSGADYIEWLKLGWLIENPGRAIISAATLSYLPPLLDILPLYLILLGFAPLLIYLVKRDWRIALLLSGLVYGLTWGGGWNLPAGMERDWYFDPFAWQFLYTVGITLTHLSRTAPDKLRRNKRWLIGALAFVGFAALVAGPLDGMALTRIAPLSYLWPADKTFLAPLRVVNVLALVYVFGFFVSPQAPWLKSKFADLVVACGRHSLPIYSFGVLLSCAGYIVMTESNSKSSADWVVNLVGIVILLLVAAMLDWHGRGKRSASPASNVAAQNRTAI